MGSTPIPTFFKSSRRSRGRVILLQLAVVFIFLFLMFQSRLALAQNPLEKQFITESCSEFISMIGKKSDQISPSEVIAGYNGKWARWTGNVTAIQDTLWGAEVSVVCSQAGKTPDVTIFVDSRPALSTGKQISFTGQVDGFSEMGGILVKGAEVKAEVARSVQVEPKPVSPPVFSRPSESAAPSTGGSRPTESSGTQVTDPRRAMLNDIGTVARSYFGFVQSRQVERAIALYAVSKRPNVKRNVIEGVARDTEYYRIDRIDSVRLEPLDARVVVYVWHKRIKGPEEYWEIFMDFIHEQGEWRILSTPGKRIR